MTYKSEYQLVGHKKESKMTFVWVIILLVLFVGYIILSRNNTKRYNCQVLTVTGQTQQAQADGCNLPQ